MKIAIIGNAGSGKTTVALQLHKLLHIFHFSILISTVGIQGGKKLMVCVLKKRIIQSC